MRTRRSDVSEANQQKRLVSCSAWWAFSCGGRVLHAWDMADKTTELFTKCGASGPMNMGRHVDHEWDKKCRKCVKAVLQEANVEFSENRALSVSAGTAGYASKGDMTMDKKRMVAGQKLLDAAQEFWNACQEEGQYGAVQWLEGTNNELIIYTRAEYRQQLLSNIHGLPSAKVHFFQGEVMPIGDEEA